MAQRNQKQEQKPARASSDAVGEQTTSNTTNTNHTENTMTQQTEVQMIPLSQLFRSALNVRKSGSGDVSDLAASIKATKGVVQNLVATPEKKGKRDGFGVVAGGRRLDAMALLLKSGEFNAETLVPVKIVSREEAVEISTAENMLRTAMHPADEFEAFNAMIESGKTVEEVAERFGTQVRKVEQRMKLARVSKKIIAAYRAGELTLDVVEAFTLTDDHKKQETILKGSRYLHAYDVRRALIEEGVRESDRRVRYVGEDAYTAAGGVVNADLFTDARYYLNPEILDRLTAAKLQAQANKLAKTFAWVEVEAEADWQTRQAYGDAPMIDGEISSEVAEQLAALRARMEALEEVANGDDEEAAEAAWSEQEDVGEQLEKLEASIKIPHPDAASLAGAVVMLKDSGKVEILRGVLRKADRTKLMAKAKGEDAGGEEQQSGSDPNAVRIDLSAFATGVAQVATANNIPVALRLLGYQLARAIVRTGYGSIVEVRATVQHSLTRNSDALKGSTAGAALDALDEHWAGILPDEDGELLAWCLNADDATVNALLAYATARTINGVQNFTSSGTVAPILPALGVDLRQHWTPNAAYFAKLKKSETLRVLGEHGHTGPELAKMKRDALAARAAELLAGTGWLPPTLRL